MSLSSDLAAQEDIHMDCLNLKVSAHCVSETSISIYQLTWYNIQGDWNLHGVEHPRSEKARNELASQVLGAHLEKLIGTPSCITHSLVK